MKTTLRSVLVSCLLTMALVAPTLGDSCLADPSWVNDPVLLATIPGGGETFCSFHQFAWQNFLTLIQKNAFLTFVPSDRVFVATGAPAPWTNSPKPLSLGQLIKEAGSKKPLVAQNGQMVQFDVRINRSWYDAVVSDRLYTTAGFNRLCTNINAPIENQDPNDKFGAIELKSSWLPMNCTPQSGDVCSTDGKYGLTGMHIVQKMSNHQEWVWASFEHVANSPDCVALGAKPPAPFGKWSFFNGDFTPCGGPGQPTCSAKNCNPTCNVYQTTGASNVCRQTPIATDDLDGSGGPLVVQLNASVHSMLTNPNLTVLKNYDLVGTLWFQKGLTAKPALDASNPPAGQRFIGSVDLANTTMETYTQQLNCYSCHVTSLYQFSYNQPKTAFGDLVSSEADFSHLFSIQQGSNVTPPCQNVPPAVRAAAAAKSSSQK